MTTAIHNADNRSLHADAVGVLSSWQAPTRQQEQLRRVYLKHLATEPDAVLRSCSPDHLTASALIVSPDRRHVLLTLHRRVGRWLQTGGHSEPSDTTLGSVALREAEEESGISGLTLTRAPMLLSRHEVPFCGSSQPAGHLDVQYGATAPPRARIRISDESDDLQWWPVDALPTDLDDTVRSLVSACT